MANYPNKLIEAFASQALKVFYMKSVSDAITNSDYEGQIKDTSSILNVLTFGKLSAQNYTGGNSQAAPQKAAGLTDAQVAMIRESDPKEYRRLIKSGQINIEI